MDVVVAVERERRRRSDYSPFSVGEVEIEIERKKDIERSIDS